MATERYNMNDTDLVTTESDLAATDTTTYDDADGTMGQVSGTGAGAISGGVIGGAVGGPIGAVVGAVAGGILGSAAGEAAHHIGDDTSSTVYDDTAPVSGLDTTYGSDDLYREGDIGDDLPGIRSDEQVYTGNADTRSIAERAAEDTINSTPQYDSAGKRIA